MPLAQKNELSLKIYFRATILFSLGLFVSGILFYLGVLGAAPLIFPGVVTAIALGATAIATKPHEHKKFETIDPDEFEVNEIIHVMYYLIVCMRTLTFIKKPKNEMLNDLHLTLTKNYDTPEKRKEFKKEFRKCLYFTKCLDDGEFKDSEEYYRVVQKILERIDPKNSIKDKENLIPKMKMEVIIGIYQEISEKLGLKTKNYKEIFGLRGEVQNHAIELLESQGDGVEKRGAIKGIYNLIDPHCVIFSRNSWEQTLFLLEDLESFLSKEVPTANDLPTQLYLDTLSDIAGTKLTKPLPVNQFFITGEKAHDFTQSFTQEFKDNLSLYKLHIGTEKKKRNEIELEVVKKLYEGKETKIPNFLFNSCSIRRYSHNKFSDYAKTIKFMCEIAIKGLELTNITDSFTAEQKREQLDLTELRLRTLIISNYMNIPCGHDPFECIVWDCMKMIYPRFTHLFEARLSNFKRPKECPEITDSPNLFEQFEAETVSEANVTLVETQKITSALPKSDAKTI